MNTLPIPSFRYNRTTSILRDAVKPIVEIQEDKFDNHNPDDNQYTYEDLFHHPVTGDETVTMVSSDLNVVKDSLTLYTLEGKLIKITNCKNKVNIRA